jgi:hypothetical protein
MVDALHLVGTPDRIRARFAMWKSLPIGTLVVAARQVEALRLLAELAGG